MILEITLVIEFLENPPDINTYQDYHTVYHLIEQRESLPGIGTRYLYQTNKTVLTKERVIAFVITKKEIFFGQGTRAQHLELCVVRCLVSPAIYDG